MSKLKAVKPKTAEPKKPAILVMGEAGVGKTWTSLDFPNVFYVDVERGATNKHYTDKLEKSGGAYLGIEQGSQNFDEVLEQVRALRSEKHNYKTLVIDSFSKLFNIEQANESERIKKSGKKDEFGASKKPAIAKSRELIGLMGSIDMNVILITHVKPKWANGEQDGVTFDGYEKLEYELDLVLEVKKQGSARKAFIRKSRLEKFPEATSIEWSYEEFANRWGRDVIEKDHKAVELASPEQLAKLAKLNDVLKTTLEEKDKHLGWADVTRYEDMPADKIAVVIGRLESKINVTKE